MLDRPFPGTPHPEDPNPEDPALEDPNPQDPDPQGPIMNSSKTMSRLVLLVSLPLLGCLSLSVQTGLAPSQDPQDPPEYRTVEFTVPVDIAGNTRAVSLKTQVGSLRVAPTEERAEERAELHVAVRARLDLVEESEVTDRAADHFRVEQEGGSLVIESLHRKAEGEEGPTAWQVSFTLRLPRPLAVTATTEVGDIEVVDVQGSAHLAARVGDVSLDTDTADSVSATTAVGDIDLRCPRVTGSLEVQSGTGDLNLAIGSVGEHACFKTGVGDIDLDYIRGLSAQLELSTGIGRIRATGTEVGSTGGGMAHHASVEVGQGGNRIAVVTGIGDITLRHIGGVR